MVLTCKFPTEKFVYLAVLSLLEEGSRKDQTSPTSLPTVHLRNLTNPVTQSDADRDRCIDHAQQSSTLTPP